MVYEVLQTYLEEIRSGTAALKYDIQSWGDLLGWFLTQVALQESLGMTRGCPFGTIGNEVTENDELIRQDLSLIFEVMKSKLTPFFVREKSQGRLVKATDPELMAEFCIATIQGGMLMGKTKRSAKTVEVAIRECFAHLKSYTIPPDRQLKGLSAN